MIHKQRLALALFFLSLTTGLTFVSQAGAVTPLPAGVTKICSIAFDKDEKRPARIEDGALSCLNEVTLSLKKNPTLKVVIVASADPAKDHAEKDHGDMREQEDASGADLRFEDISMYRAINAKDYLVRWNHAAPAKVIPTTDEHTHSQEAIFYLVPGDADFTHNYLGTTKTNEKVCTVKPCYDPREEYLTPQPRGRILNSRNSSHASR